jgi:hypothetical protein
MGRLAVDGSWRALKSGKVLEVLSQLATERPSAKTRPPGVFAKACNRQLLEGSLAANWLGLAWHFFLLLTAGWLPPEGVAIGGSWGVLFS